MITKDTGIVIKVIADNVYSTPETAVRFVLLDENDKPIAMKYDTNSLCSMGDDRLAALQFGINSINGLIYNVVCMRNEQLALLAKEMSELTGESIKYAPIENTQGATGLSVHLPPNNSDI